MSFEEYVSGAYQYYLTFASLQRMGQAYFNFLPATVANKVRGTEIDPFYDDAILPLFLASLAEDWEGFNNE